ncbi:superoxide dismutase, Ni [Marinomonas ostreistagni]|uniref:superoxide dismutase, Ni n=1 Tax=Marinomonas ostreistagni TaxID=359209 RepID=UPI00194FAA77|nr:superoxide dismutase, Ni [Marinomonas ostreistagni]MBM6550726.1 superoxide dismutase, Ni [Marinomonas ostreistagni]
MLHGMLSKLDRLLTLEQASAHCDIPCKIYDPYMAQYSALSVLRMMDLIAELSAKESLSIADHAQLARVVAEKETHAEKAKHEVRVIWGDYFKQPQFEQYPDISDLVHRIMLAGSACKQGIERDKAENFISLINEFAAAFWTTKGIETYTATAPFPPSVPVVYAKLGD